MLSRLGEGLMKGQLNQSGRRRVCAHKIPSLVLYCPEFFLAHHSKDTLRGTGRGVKFEVQRDDIGRVIAEVIEAEKELVDDLERVVTGSESKHCMQGRHDASTGGEVEMVAVAILSETTVCRPGELSGQDVGVGVVPLNNRMRWCDEM